MSNFNNDKLTYSPISPSEEDHTLISENETYPSHNQHRRQDAHIKILYAIILALSFCIAILSVFLMTKSKDPSLQLWSPANEVVSYKIVSFDSYFLNRSPYLGTPAKEKDKMWEDLYDFGISGLSESESRNLVNSTLPAPNDPSTFVVQLNVFHLLHCVNLLRKAIYKDEYPGWEFKEDGRVDHDTVLGFHWDHCLDTFRQSIMCDADVTPLPFTHEHEGDYNIFPVLAGTHTCRDFGKISEWAKGRQIKSWIGMEKHQ